jgi:hypothetical protein
MRHNIIHEKTLVPGIKVNASLITDLASDPIAMRKVTLELSDSLLKKIGADIMYQRFVFSLRFIFD